jgi:hypothetical protein
VLRFLVTTLCLLTATPALAKEYSASRFDSRVEVLDGGDLRVTETVVFTFTGGTFTEVFRTIPTRRTDGVEFVGASMDGRPFTEGEGPGRIRLQRKNGLRVVWKFAPVSNSSHTFKLTYLANGVVQQTADFDLLLFRPMPADHDYRIASSRVEVMIPAAPERPPQLETRRVDGASEVRVENGVIAAVASDIRRNGWIVVSAALPRGSVLDGPPAWQAREASHRARMPIWLTTAAGVCVAGFVLLFGLRTGYDRPPREQVVQWPSLIPPDSVAPAIAGALVANGQPQLEHAMGSLFSLAERGVMAIREEPGGIFGQRSFVIEITRGSHALSTHEEAARDIIFAGSSGPGATVSLSKARTRLTRHWTRFKKAVQRELNDQQLLDPHRLASRRRYMKTGLILIALAVLTAAGCVLLVEEHGGWPFLIPAALAVVALTSFIVMSSQTPLSNEGVRRADQWRAYRKHLASPQEVESRWGAAGSAEARILPFAIALGLAAAWSKFMKKRHVKTPAWFHAASGLESGHAFAAFVASGGAGFHGGGTPGAHGGGSVAGGGASGAR